MFMGSGYCLFCAGYIIAVNRLEIVAHGYGNPAVFFAGSTHLVGFLLVAQFAFGIITEQGEGKCLVFIVGDGVVEHTGITRGVTKGEYRLQIGRASCRERVCSWV